MLLAMQTATTTYNLPATLTEYWRTKEMAEKKITEASVLALYRDEKVSISKGAKLLDIPVQDFLELMYANGLTEWDDTPEEIKQGLKDLRSLRKKYGLPKKKEKKI